MLLPDIFLHVILGFGDPSAEHRNVWLVPGKTVAFSGCIFQTGGAKIKISKNKYNDVNYIYSEQYNKTFIQF